MQLGLAKDLIETTIIVEVILIAVIILFTYFAKLGLYLREKRKQKLVGQIEHHFTNLLTTKQPLSSQKFYRRWKKIQILFPIFQRHEKMYQNNSAWENLRKDILLTILLPLARKRGRSRRWVLRFFSCETLSLINEPSDEKIIMRLVRDRIPLVYLHAINAAIRLGSETAINAIITRMSKMSWLTQSMYIEPFEHAPVAIRNIIEKRLTSSQEANIRAESYKILRKFPVSKITWDIKQDLNSKDFELRLSSLKYLVYANQEEAIPVLKEKLKDEHWEIRLVAIHRLGRLKIENAMTQIADCLTDNEWWVKISAAQALKNFGKDGEKLLQSRAPELDEIPFDATDHVSNTLW